MLIPRLFLTTRIGPTRQPACRGGLRWKAPTALACMLIEDVLLLLDMPEDPSDLLLPRLVAVQ
jgi:hypothetical protein